MCRHGWDMQLEVLAINRHRIAVTDKVEVPVDDCNEKTASDDVADGGWDHALPDVVANGDVWMTEEDGHWNAVATVSMRLS